jgi:carbonic anhydrase
MQLADTTSGGIASFSQLSLLPVWRRFRTFYGLSVTRVAQIANTSCRFLLALTPIFTVEEVIAKMADRHTRAGSGRRQFLQTAVSSALVGIGAGIELSGAARLGAQSDLSPDAALRELMAGNQRFAGNHPTSMEHDLNVLRERTVDKQEPFAAVLSCADSRVPVELVFDQTLGQIFVTRVAGNLVTPEIIGSLEYGVAVLGVKTVLVLGHGHCGAVKAAMKMETVPGQISALYPHLREAVEQSGGSLDKAIETNARIQAELLRTSSTVIRDAVKAGKLKVKAGVYDLATGNVALS